MSEELFRKKSLDKARSPESLDDYIRVSNPGIWLLLISVIVLLIGACVWGIFGHVDSTVKTNIRIENGIAVSYIQEEDISSLKVGLSVKFEGYAATVSKIGEKGENGYECILTIDSDSIPADGFYEGKIIVKSYKPISFILN